MIQHIWYKCVFRHIWFYLFAYACKYKDTLASICFSICLYPYVLKMMSSYWSLQFHSNTMGFILVFFPRMHLLSLVMRNLAFHILNSPTHSLNPLVWNLSLQLPLAMWTLTSLRDTRCLAGPTPWILVYSAQVSTLCAGWCHARMPSAPCLGSHSLYWVALVRTRSSTSDPHVGQPSWEVTPLLDLSSDTLLWDVMVLSFEGRCPLHSALLPVFRIVLLGRESQGQGEGEGRKRRVRSILNYTI